MLVRALTVHGFRDGTDHPLDLSESGPVARLPAPPVGTAMADALSLLVSVLDPERAVGVLRWMELVGELSEPTSDEHGLLEQLVGLEPGAVAALLADGERRLVVDVTLALDPPMYGRLREQAFRDPRVATALGQDATLGLKVGWLFTPDLRTAATSLLDMRVGPLSFPVQGADRPAWASLLLRDVAVRFLRLEAGRPPEPVGMRLLENMVSPDPERRAAWRRLSRALAEEPFGLGTVEIVDATRPAVAFGAALRRARQMGPGARRALELATAVLIDTPDVLVLDEPVSPEVEAWLGAHAVGPDATLEQVIVVGGWR